MLTAPTRPPLLGGIAVAGLGALAVIVMARLPRVTVEGPSMAPTLAPGDRLLLVPARPAVGRMVVLADPRDPARLLVKRVTEVTAEGITVAGDNAAASTDSRTFGVAPHDTLVGRPLYRYAPPTAAGWIWSA